MIKLTDIWIAVPVEKELPKKSEAVTAITKGGINVRASYEKGIWFYWDGGNWNHARFTPAYFLRHPTLAELLQVEGMREILNS
jgi:hypothetical protein